MSAPATCAGGRPTPPSSIARPHRRRCRRRPCLRAACRDPRRLHGLSRSLAVRHERQRASPTAVAIASTSIGPERRRAQPGFARPRALRSGNDYVAGRRRAPAAARTMRRSRPIAPACARAAGPMAAPIGVLAIHFDWEPQARAIVEGRARRPTTRRACCWSIRTCA